MAKRNKRDNYFRELAGLRVVTMYVQEYFHWGWQQLDQENDDGIDGYVIVRDGGGRDMGCNIRVQIKSGPSFLSSRPNGGKQVTIRPYSSEDRLTWHMEDYAKAVQPVIMVWVNTHKEKDGKEYEDLLHPEAWWERVDKYNYQGGTVITLTHKLGEHSKGDWFNTVKPILKSWQNHPLIKMDADDKKLYYSQSLSVDGLNYYKEWQNRKTQFARPDGNVCEVKKGRTGWRHINNYLRGRFRTSNSLKLLSIADKIIQNKEAHPVSLGFSRHSRNGVVVKYGLRARVLESNSMTHKVQVVLLRNYNKAKNKDEWSFFSVHVVK